MLRETPPSPSLPLAVSLRCRCSVGVENFLLPLPRFFLRLQAASKAGKTGARLLTLAHRRAINFAVVVGTFIAGLAVVGSVFGAFGGN